MDLHSVVLLSLIEGITEFLPISSTAHLIIASLFLRLPQTEFLKTFQIFIQLGAILAVLSLYYNTIKKQPKLIILLLISFIPIAIVGLVLFKTITTIFFDNIYVIASAIFIGGVALIASDILTKDKRAKVSDIKNITPKNALFIGIAQCFSVVPGTSRAAACIVGGLAFGLNKKTAVEYSFLLGLPTIAAAAAIDLIKNAPHFTQFELNTLIIGCIFSFAFAYFAVKAFIALLSKNALVYFGVYRIILAIILLILFL